MRRTWLFSALVLATALAVLAWYLWRPPGLVHDRAGIMAEEQRQKLAQFHAFLLADHDIDYQVVTASDVGDINGYAVERFQDLRVGQRSQAGHGLLLVIDFGANLVRLEVSYSLEGVFPDAFIAYVEKRQMVPFFANGRFMDGILATTELIVARVQNEKAKTGFAGEVWLEGSGGAGATTAAGLGGTDPNSGLLAKTSRSDTGLGRSPEETLALYLEAMAARNASPELSIYTAESQVMLRDWVVTPAQMDNIVKTYRRCTAEAPQHDATGRLAVIRYPPTERACAPWFFRRVANAWALDLTLMGRAIRFGRNNAWHFDPGVDHPYGFAFRDWRFDSQGFPHR